ncbi:MAG: hypothetical protein H8E98_06245 [Bacteroidetes bacterium]|nr:hypothetical protein [Bacteroidota bacterium]
MNIERYGTNKIILKNKKRMYNTTIYPKIEKSAKDIYIYAVKGDRLDLLAYDYYHDVELWFVIAHANGIGRGTMYVEPNKQVRIPETTKVNQFLLELEELNNVR